MTPSVVTGTSSQRSTLRPDRALLASAQRMTQKKMKKGFGKGQSWQNDAWDMFDLVGEARFLATMLANRMSQAQFYIGQVPDDPTEEPVPVENNPALTDILEALGGSASARSQMFTRLGINLFVTGDGWLVGIPRHRMPDSFLTGPLDEPDVDIELLLPPEELDDTIDITTLHWRVFSVNEVSGTAGGEVTLRMGESAEDQLIISPDELMMVRVWRSHPRKWWEADSPIRSSLPVLRELVGLTMRSSAEIDSRLAGAGLLIVPHGAARALAVAAGIEDPDNAPDQFTEALMEAMLTPIADRSSASAVVPLVVTVPDELVDKFVFMDFAKPLDEMQPDRVDQAVRRLALGLDAPPELLLGTGGMSHWGAWLVLEDVVSTHLEPPLALIADALTTQYLWPVLMGQGMSADEARRYVIWYDVSDLVVRPTRAADAQSMHAAGVISDASLRMANGFDDSDAPAVESPSNTPAIEMALDMIRAAPGLMSDPGLPQLVAQIQSVLDGNIPEVVDPVAAKAAASAAGRAPAGGQAGGIGNEAGTANTADTGPAIRLAPPVGPAAADPTRQRGLAASAGEIDWAAEAATWGAEGAWDPRALASRQGAWMAAGSRLAAEQTARLTEEQPEAPEQAEVSRETGPAVAGLAVLANDTGRVLMIQRSNEDLEDPARGTWEFPGGHIDEGEQPQDAALREFGEETGIDVGQGPVVREGWTSPNGVYQGFVLEIDNESSIAINPPHDERTTLNPDDPDGDDVETVIWVDPAHLEGWSALRPELAADLDVVLEALGADPAGARDTNDEPMTASALAARVIWSADTFKITKSDSNEPTKDKKGDDSGTTPSSGPGITRDEIGRFAPGGSGGKGKGDAEVAQLDQQLAEIDKQLAELESSSSGGSGGGSSSGGGSGGSGGSSAAKKAAGKSDAQKTADAKKVAALKAKKAEIKKKVTDAKLKAEAAAKVAETKKAVDKGLTTDARNAREQTRPGARTSTPAKEAAKKATATSTKPGTEAKPGNVTDAPVVEPISRTPDKTSDDEKRDRGLTASGGWGAPIPGWNVAVTSGEVVWSEVTPGPNVDVVDNGDGTSTLRPGPGFGTYPDAVPLAETTSTVSAADFPSANTRAAQDGQR